MYEDKGVGVETYLSWLKLVVLQLRVLMHISSFYSHSSEQGYDISMWGSPQEKSTNETRCQRCEYS